MLADSVESIPQSGRLDKVILLQSTAKLELVDFIANELPSWRDDPDRLVASGEHALTVGLCSHLNSAVYYSNAWDHIQFMPENPDETRGNRKYDIAVKPRAAKLIIEGRRHSHFNVLFPLECKRLPTPKEKDRDEREYVTNEPSTTGGIQRYKFCYHGSTHNFAVIIAYIEEQTFIHWLHQVNFWIQELAIDVNSAWSDSDILCQLNENLPDGVCILKSEHQRTGSYGKCELRHLWIKMS